MKRFVIFGVLFLIFLSNSVEAARLVTHTVPFEEVESGFGIAQRGDGLKTVVLFEESDESEHS